MNHGDVWRAVDTLAAELGLSVSALARQAGLDPTTFNLSKRRSADGRMRWPSTESLAKVLHATGMDLTLFATLVNGAHALPPRLSGPQAALAIPLIGLHHAGARNVFDENGHPLPTGSWNELILPHAHEPHMYALQANDASMAPVLREGDKMIVSPTLPVRRGDRAVIHTLQGEVIVKEILDRSALQLELRSLNPARPDRRFDLTTIAWVHRIVWISQ